jgi:hypothetical protein
MDNPIPRRWTFCGTARQTPHRWPAASLRVSADPFERGHLATLRGKERAGGRARSRRLAVPTGAERRQPLDGASRLASGQAPCSRILAGALTGAGFDLFAKCWKGSLMSDGPRKITHVDMDAF